MVTHFYIGVATPLLLSPVAFPCSRQPAAGPLLPDCLPDCLSLIGFPSQPQSALSPLHPAQKPLYPLVYQIR